MTPYIVVDAAVAGAWLFAEVYSSHASAMLKAIEQRRVIALAPDRFEEELLRICQKKLRPPPVDAGLRPADSFGRFLDLMTAPIPIYLLPSQELHERACDMAASTPGLTTHDALYLALAERWGAELWTTDAVLAGAGVSAVYRNVHDLRTESFPH